MQRKLPVNYDMLNWLRTVFYSETDPVSSRCELACAVLMGFLFFLRVSELEKLTWNKVELDADIDGDPTLTIVLVSSKTDQFNEGEKKVLKSLQSPLCPVRMLSQWKTLRDASSNPKAEVFGGHLREKLTAALRLAGMECNVEGSRLGTHSVRSGGASAMFTAGYEVEVIKRWGRWVSSNFQSYIWKGRYFMSSVGRGMLANLPLQSLERGRAGGGGKRGAGRFSDAERRSIDISHSMSKVLRHKGVRGMQRDGFAPLKELLNHAYMVERNVTRKDIQYIVQCGGGNNKNRFQIGVMADGITEAIRAAQGRSLGIGVDSDVLPLANDVTYVAHGTSLRAAQNIAVHGLNRGDRVHMHFMPCDRDGVVAGVRQVREGSQALVIVTAVSARDAGIHFYRAPNNVILPDGIDGAIPPRIIRSIRSLPSFDLLWTNEDRQWKVPAIVKDGNPLGMLTQMTRML